MINLNTNQDAGQTINMQSAVKAQTNPSKLFITQPWAIAFKNNSDAGLRGERRQQHRREAGRQSHYRRAEPSRRTLPMPPACWRFRWAATRAES